MSPETRKLIEKKYGELKSYPDGFSVKEAMHTAESGKVAPIMQEKPWGAEVWLIYSPKYALKHIIVEAGKRFSMQKHTEKMETWCIVSGNPTVTLGDKKITAAPGEIIHVDPGTTHRVESGDSHTEILEVSSPELWDVTRLEDDYGR